MRRRVFTVCHHDKPDLSRKQIRTRPAYRHRPTVRVQQPHRPPLTFITQIYEGANQIQRVVMGRQLLK